MMRKICIPLLTAVLVATGAVTPPAGARNRGARNRGARNRAPVATTLYMHGNFPVGDYVEWVRSNNDGIPMQMNPEEPAAGPPKSMTFSPIVGNDECTGNELFPSWESRLSGTIVGDVTMHANFLAPPSSVIARIWTDIPFGSCKSETTGSDNFRPPLAEVEVEIPGGQNEVEIVFEDIKKKVFGNLIVELHQLSVHQQGRVLYDSADVPTRLEFNCVPTSGSSCV